MNIDELLDKKALAGRGIREMWKPRVEAFSRDMRMAGLDEHWIQQWILACPSPQNLSAVSGFFHVSTDDNDSINTRASEFAEAVDDSPFSMTEWMRALEEFLKVSRIPWVETNHSRVLAYLCCCSEYAARESDMELSHAVRILLMDFGFENRDA